MTAKFAFDVRVVTPLQENCFLVKCLSTDKAVVIDPGGDIDKIRAMIDQHNVCVEAIWLTHGHVDHVAGVSELNQDLKVPIIGPHKADALFIKHVDEIVMKYGMLPTTSFEPDQWLEDGDTLQLGEVSVKVLHCPGHSPGSVVFVLPDESFAFVGDVLFRNSIGRTDLQGSNHEDLISSITQKLWPLGDLRFQCGHGNGSSFAIERQSNPFVADIILQQGR